MTGAVSVVVRYGNDHSVVSPRGPIFSDTREPLADALLLLTAGQRPRVVLDLSGVDLCDSSGLNLMVQAHRVASRHGGWVRLTGVRPAVRLVLEVTNLTRILTIYDSAEAAADDP